MNSARAILIGLLFFVPTITLAAPLYQPGETLNPACLPTDADCTVATSTASYFTATSTTATSTFPNLSLTNLLIGSDYVTDITGSGLSIVDGALTASGGAFATTTASYWINNVGNIGIGTSSPYTKLSVVGDIVATAITATSSFNTSGTTGGYKIDGNLILQASSTNSSLTIGQSAGTALLADGLGNTVLGYEALRYATSSDYNTALGYRALFTNNIGERNTAMGYASLFGNTTGSNNVANGYASLYANTTGNYNISQGAYSMYTNTTGSYNVANGYTSLYFNTTGGNNSAIGPASLYFNTTGSQNIAVGRGALQANTTGSNNTATGYTSLYSNSTGAQNTASGMYSLYYATTSTYSTAIGYLSGVGSSLTANDYNTSIDTNMTFLGALASRDNNTASTTGITNSTAIGYNAKVGGSNMLVLGNAANVGIGTSTPSSKLTVTAPTPAITSHQMLTLYANDAMAANIGGTIGFGGNYTTGGSLASWASIAGLKENGATGDLAGYLQFGTRSAAGTNAEVMRISSTGNVGIGTTSPLARLAVTGRGLYTARAFEVADSANSPKFTVLDNGNVGVGTVSPDKLVEIVGGADGVETDLLQIRSNFTSANTGSTLKFVNSTSATNDITSGELSVIRQASGANMAFRVGDGAAMTERLTIVGASGNVGIGTTSPYAKLSVVGDIIAKAITATSTFNTSGTTGGYKIDDRLILQSSTTNSSLLIGQNAGLSLLSDGTYNTAVGGESLRTATSSDYLTAVGYRTLYSNTTGLYNTAMGYRSLDQNTTGGSNVGYGPITLFSNTTGNYNVAQGYAALYYNTTGTANTAIGYNAGRGEGVNLDQNTVLDNFATFVGYTASRAESVSSTTQLANITAIGKNARVGASNSLVLGGTGTDSVKVGIGTTTPLAYLDLLSTQGGSTALFSIASSTSGTGTSTAFYVARNGNVSIGTSTTNTALLTVMGLGTQASPSTIDIVGQNYAVSGDALLSLSQSIGSPALRMLVPGTDSRTDGRTANDGYLDAGQGLHLRAGGNGSNGYAFAYNSEIHIGNATDGTIVFRTNVKSATSTERMRLDSFGTLGLGTTSPYAKLSISSTDTASTTLALRPISGQTANILDIYNTGGTLTSVIDRLGNWGIGTSTPVGNGLTISAASVPQLTFADQSLAAGAHNFLMRYNSSIGTGVFQIGSAVDAGSASVMNLNLDRSGYVGIGTTTPRNKLEIVGTAVTGGSQCDTSNDLLCLQNNVSTGINIITPSTLVGAVNFSDGTRAVGRLNYDHNVDAMSMWTGSSQRLTVDSSGNVGIGTTTTDVANISEKLVVTGDIFIDNIAFNSGMALGMLGGVPYIQGANAANTGVKSLLLQPSGGSVGIGTTTPSSRLSVTQSANTSAGGLWIAETGNTDFRSIYMATDGTMSFYGGDTSGALNTATLNSSGAWTNASDKSYKENIVDLGTKYGLAAVLASTPRFYEMKGNHVPQVGFIAQELEAIIPEVVEGKEGSKGISYGNLVAVAFQAIKELDAKVASTSAVFSEWVGQKVSATLAAFKHVDTDTITAQTATITNGIEMKDKKTGKTYCLTVYDGDIEKEEGQCKDTEEVKETPKENNDKPKEESSKEEVKGETATTTATTTPEVIKEEPKEKPKEEVKPQETASSTPETVVEEPKKEEEKPVEEKPTEEPKKEEVKEEVKSEEPAKIEEPAPEPTKEEPKVETPNENQP